jgi:DNA-directed RNA polymerase alpha subunit
MDKKTITTFAEGLIEYAILNPDSATLLRRTAQEFEEAASLLRAAADKFPNHQQKIADLERSVKHWQSVSQLADGRIAAMGHRLAILTDILRDRADPHPAVASATLRKASLAARVDELSISVRAANCFRDQNIVHVGDLVKKSAKELLLYPNFGRKSLKEIEELLSSMGLRLGMDEPCAADSVELYMAPDEFVINDEQVEREDSPIDLS